MSDSGKHSTRPKKPVLSLRKRQANRREFIHSAVLTTAVVGISLVGLLPVVQGHSSRLRPPGAIKRLLDEQEFFASCIKCGQCVQVCPVNAIKLADINDGVGLGVPYIDAREQACDFSCDGLQCVLACPTGALTHDLDYPADTRMGFARLSKPASCLAVRGEGFKGAARAPEYQGLLRYDEIDRWNPLPVAEHQYDLEICDLCVRQCPIEIRIAQCEAKAQDSESTASLGRVAEQHGNECPPKHAIQLRQVGDSWTPEVLDGCVGCGVCEMICPLEEGPAIVVDIDKTADSV